MPITARQHADRVERVCAVLDRLVPAIRVCGLPIAYSVTRWVGPPWSAVLRQEGSSRIEVRLGERQMLIAEWQKGHGVTVHHFAAGEWDAELLASLPPA